MEGTSEVPPQLRNREENSSLDSSWFAQISKSEKSVLSILSQSNREQFPSSPNFTGMP